MQSNDNFKSTSESVYAKNIQNSQSDSSASQNSEYVIYDGKMVTVRF